MYKNKIVLHLQRVFKGLKTEEEKIKYLKELIIISTEVLEMYEEHKQQKEE